jgi:hypothetical protein
LLLALLDTLYMGGTGGYALELIAMRDGPTEHPILFSVRTDPLSCFLLVYALLMSGTLLNLVTYHAHNISVRMPPAAAIAALSRGLSRILQLIQHVFSMLSSRAAAVYIYPFSVTTRQPRSFPSRKGKGGGSMRLRPGSASLPRTVPSPKS